MATIRIKRLIAERVLTKKQEVIITICFHGHLRSESYNKIYSYQHGNATQSNMNKPLYPCIKPATPLFKIYKRYSISSSMVIMERYT